MSNNTITSITLPEGLTSIEDEAFSGCNLTSITIPESVTSIGKSAFDICSGLTSAIISPKVTLIGEYAFYDCSGLIMVTIPPNVTSIGEYAFYGCSLISVVCKSSTPPNIENIGWIVEKINVSASSVDLYKTAEGWKDYNIEAITSIN